MKNRWTKNYCSPVLHFWSTGNNDKVKIFWEGHRIFKFCGILKISELIWLYSPKELEDKNKTYSLKCQTL